MVLVSRLSVRVLIIGKYKQAFPMRLVPFPPRLRGCGEPPYLRECQQVAVLLRRSLRLSCHKVRSHPMFSLFALPLE